MKNFRAIESSPVPLYAQVREILRERILDGSYQPHAQLPAESEMSGIFGISRITVRQALSDLQKEGVIFKVPGKGSYVSKPKAFQQLTHLEGLGEAMSRMGHDIHNQVTGLDDVPASHHVAQQLGAACRSAYERTGNLPAVAPVLRISEIRTVGAYGLQFVFSDGHDRGIFPWPYWRWLVQDENDSC